MKLILKYLTLLLLFSVSTARAGGIWTYHPTSSGLVERIFDGPTNFYLLSPAQIYRGDIPENDRRANVLFVYDKQTDELRPMGRAAGLANDLIERAEYNPDRKYLLLVYEDSNIDLLFDDGNIINIPGLKTASSVTDRAVNDITFDPANNLAYLATGFGYCVINDLKGEIANSRIYNRPLRSVAAVGQKIVVADEVGNLWQAPIADPRLNWDNYSQIEAASGVDHLLPLSDTKCAMLTTVNKSSSLQLLDLEWMNPIVKNLRAATDYSYHRNKAGYLVGTGNRILQVAPDGTFTMAYRDAADENRPVASADFTKFYFAKDGEGFYSRRATHQEYSTDWTTLSAPVIPAGPEPFLSTGTVWNPKYGFLVVNHGLNQNFASQAMANPLQISALRDEAWTQYGLARRAPQQTAILSNPDGIVTDPDNPSLVYCGSLLTGMVRINLEDPNDILHLSRPDERWENLPGFVKVHETNPDWLSLSQLTSLHFDADGNLWMLYNNYNQTPATYLKVWTAENRRASKTAATFRPLSNIAVSGLTPGSTSQVLPLKVGANRGIVIVTEGGWNGNMAVIDTKNTPTVTSDDTRNVFSYASLRNTDGQLCVATYVYCLFEDPQSGQVWVGTDNGIFAFNPRTALSGTPTVTQFKISRNDGTSLADYLLSGVTVNHITVDSANRKWISTSGAGLVCVSADGREVISEANTDNSDIPSDIVYTAEYSPETSTMMVATSNGLATFRPYARGDGSDFESARAYPNPVRPGFGGYVTIDGLADNAIVKIANERGQLVRELGFAANGEVTWDVADMNHRRVGTGVYFVMASSGPNDESMAKVTKILVVN